jgi:oligopeptide transport system substrate-binding protein
MRQTSTILSAALAALLFSAPLFSTAAQAEHVLRRASDGEPESLDPQKTTGLYESCVERDLFVGLLTLDRDMKPAPGVAASWEASDDKKIWTFHLRHDAVWSNGDPVVAGDFVYSFRRLADPKTAASETEEIQDIVNAEEIIAGKETDLTKLGIEAVDPYTVRITLRQPQIMLPELLTDNNVVPLDRKAVEGVEDWTRPGKIVSNGAFLLTDWTPHAEIVVRKNPKYYDAAAVKLDGVRWILNDNLETGFKRFRADELDVARVPRQQIKWARENLADQLRTGDLFGNYNLIIDMKKGELKDHPKIREALSLAVDRDLIVTKIVPTGQKPSYSLVSPNTTDYAVQSYDWKDKPLAERLPRAKQLMAEEGYGPDHPFRFEVTYTTDDTSRTMMLAIASMWKPLGVEVTLQNQEWQVYESTLRQKGYTMGMLGGVMTYDDAKQFVDAYTSTANDQNQPGYSNPAYDALVAKATVATDIETRADYMQQAEKVFLADYPIIPLYYANINMLVSTKVVGWQNGNPYMQSQYLSLKD